MKHEIKTAETVFGAGLDRKEQWPLLLEAAADREGLEDIYDEWLISLDKGLQNFRATGIKPLKGDVDMEELLAWCRAKGRKNDDEARAEFFTKLLRQGRGKPFDSSR